MNQAHCSEIALTLSAQFFENIDNFLSVEVTEESTCAFNRENFKPNGDFICTIDFVGEVCGFLAITCEHEDMAKIYVEAGELEPDATTVEYEQAVFDPTKEIVNTSAGKCQKLILDYYPWTTMQSPKIVMGRISFPNIHLVTCKTVTRFGNFYFHCSFNTARLAITRKLELLIAAEQNTQQIALQISAIHHTVEDLRLSTLREVSSANNQVEAFKKEATSCSISSEQLDNLTTNIETIEKLVGRDIQTKIIEIQRCKNSLLTQLVCNKIKEDDKEAIFELQGTLDDEPDLSPLSSCQSHSLYMDVNQLLLFTPHGISRWNSKLKDFTAREIHFTNASTEFILAVLFEGLMIQPGSLDSMSITSTCDSCLNVMHTSLSITGSGVENISVSSCDYCQGKMTPCDHAIETIITFETSLHTQSK